MRKWERGSMTGEGKRGGEGRGETRQFEVRREGERVKEKSSLIDETLPPGCPATTFQGGIPCLRDVGSSGSSNEVDHKRIASAEALRKGRRRRNEQCQRAERRDEGVRRDSPCHMLSVGKGDNTANGPRVRRVLQSLEEVGRGRGRSSTDVPNVDGSVSTTCIDLSSIRGEAGLKLR